MSGANETNVRREKEAPTEKKAFCLCCCVCMRKDRQMEQLNFFFCLLYRKEDRVKIICIREFKTKREKKKPPVVDFYPEENVQFPLIFCLMYFVHCLTMRLVHDSFAEKHKCK